MISITGNSINDWNDNGIEEYNYPFFVISSGYQKFVTRNYKIIRKSGRVDFQLIYLIKGKGYYDFGDGIKEVSEGNLIVFKPDQPQIYEYLSKDSPELYWLHFSGYSAWDWIHRFDFKNRYVYPVGIRVDLIDLFKRIIYEIQDKKPHFHYMAGSCLAELLLTFSRRLENLKSENINVHDDSIRNVIYYMYENYNRHITVRDLAEKCSLSMYRFIHKFKESTGLTPIEYITKIRIDEAIYLLSNSVLNISEIAAIVGYDDPLYFSRVFRKKTGLSPSLFQKQLKRGS